uniref:DDB1-and CUL4-associated factor 10 homolog n=1 Tax=Hirondellea gigas TaxID=1518452 RepID=A0A2P2HZS1_9CRUS
MKANKTYLSHLGIGGGFFPYAEHRRRQYGMKRRLGCENEWHHRVYQSLQPFTHWDSNSAAWSAAPQQQLHAAGLDDDIVIPNPSGNGGIFNLEFSPEGKVLAAACQNKAVVLFDPLTHKQISSINDAHTDCVNGIKFLDNRLFASCSDDHTVAIWDVRNLRQRVHTLRGHNKWVKNIEYHARDNLIVTSGFDGHVIAWDMNRSMPDGSENVYHSRLYKLHGLMRMKLSPDLNKLLLCTSSGYMLLVQNLDLEYLQRDMRAFKQINQDKLADERAVVGRTRNRPVVVRDFPAMDKAETIHSMQIHPHSWAVLSRNTSLHGDSEWTCVHDIQEFPPESPETDDASSSSEPSDSKDGEEQRGTLPTSPDDLEGEDPTASEFLGMQPTSTPRFQMLLDNRGGNWVNLAPSRGDAAPIRNLHPVLEEEDEDDDDDDDSVADHIEESDLELDLDETSIEFDRQRTIMLGLNILIQRNDASVYNNMRALGLGPAAELATAGAAAAAAEANSLESRERRIRGARGRIGQMPHFPSSPRDRIERHHLLHRYRWRVNRRLNQATPRNRDQRLPRLDPEAGLDANANGEQAPEAREGVIAGPPRIYELNWTARYNAILYRTLRSLRSDLDVVMADLNSVRRQIDQDVGRAMFDAETYRQRPTLNSRFIKTSSGFHTNYLSSDPVVKRIYAQQRPRLTHYIVEPNVGRGFIKELCFSSDGRLICSPYKNGVRLLAFDEKCSEMSHCVSDYPRPLSQIMNISNCHSKSVVSTKFSPTHTLLVSGCLDGKITWHLPAL